MEKLLIRMSPEPATEPAPTKDPETEPAEPNTSPNREDDPWKVPAPDVEPTPKA